MKRFEINWGETCDGGVRCDVWGDGCEMYPEMWNNKFYGYTRGEIRNFIRGKLEAKYKCKVVLAR